MRNFNQRGQGTVEYILLVAVAISLVLTFYRSDTFQRLFGAQGTLGMVIKTQTEFGYRNAFLDPAGAPMGPAMTIDAHPSYSGGGQTRFFGPSDPYP